MLLCRLTIIYSLIPIFNFHDVCSFVPQMLFVPSPFLSTNFGCLLFVLITVDNYESEIIDSENFDYTPDNLTMYLTQDNESNSYLQTS